MPRHATAQHVEFGLVVDLFAGDSSYQRVRRSQRADPMQCINNSALYMDCGALQLMSEYHSRKLQIAVPEPSLPLTPSVQRTHVVCHGHVSKADTPKPKTSEYGNPVLHLLGSTKLAPGKSQVLQDKYCGGRLLGAESETLCAS